MLSCSVGDGGVRTRPAGIAMEPLATRGRTARGLGQSGDQDVAESKDGVSGRAAVDVVEGGAPRALGLCCLAALRAPAACTRAYMGRVH